MYKNSSWPMTLLGRRNILKQGLIFHFLTFNLNDRHFFQISKTPFFSQTVFLLKFHIQRRPIRIWCNSRKGIRCCIRFLSVKVVATLPLKSGWAGHQAPPPLTPLHPGSPLLPSQLPYNASQCAQPDRYGYSPPPPPQAPLHRRLQREYSMVYCVPAWAEVD